MARLKNIADTFPFLSSLEARRESPSSTRRLEARGRLETWRRSSRKRRRSTRRHAKSTRHALAWGRPTQSNVPHRPLQSTHLRRDSTRRRRPTHSHSNDWQPTTSGPGDAGTGGSGTGGSSSEASRGVGGGRSFDGEGDNVHAAEDDETEGTLLFRDSRGLVSSGFGCLALDATEFFGIGEDNVHVLRRYISYLPWKGSSASFSEAQRKIATLSKAKRVPVSWRPSFIVTRIR